jgi:hypothetical protein
MSYMIKVLISSVLIIGGLGGCAGKVTGNCPLYPVPSLVVLDKLKGLHSTEVDSWMQQQVKLSRKLKICNVKD